MFAAVRLVPAFFRSRSRSAAAACSSMARMSACGSSTEMSSAQSVHTRFPVGVVGVSVNEPSPDPVSDGQGGQTDDSRSEDPGRDVERVEVR